MLILLQFTQNCPVVNQSNYKSPFVELLNEKTARISIFHSNESLLISEFEDFRTTNTIVNPDPTPNDMAGNCFSNAENAFETTNFTVEIDSCNFVQFVFPVENITMERIEIGNYSFEKKNFYIKRGEDVEIAQLLVELVIDEDVIIGRIPDDNFNLEVSLNMKGYVVKSPILARFECKGNSYKVVDGAAVVASNCRNGTAFYLNDQIFEVSFKPSSYEYVEYEYQVGDVEISQKYKNGELCTFVAEWIFLEAKQKYEFENRPNCTENQIIIALQCVDCMLGQINVNNICTDPLCEEGEIFEGGECQPIVCEEGYELINNDCVIIICEEGLNLENGVCIPIICNQDQVLVGSECVDIECEEGQEIVDGECVDGDVTMAVGLGLAGVMLALVFA